MILFESIHQNLSSGPNWPVIVPRECILPYWTSSFPFISSMQRSSAWTKRKWRTQNTSSKLALKHDFSAPLKLRPNSAIQICLLLLLLVVVVVVVVLFTVDSTRYGGCGLLLKFYSLSAVLPAWRFYSGICCNPVSVCLSVCLSYFSPTLIGCAANAEGDSPDQQQATRPAYISVRVLGRRTCLLQTMRRALKVVSLQSLSVGYVWRHSSQSKQPRGYSSHLGWSWRRRHTALKECHSLSATVRHHNW